MQVKSRNLIPIPITVATIPQQGYATAVNQWWVTDGTNVFVLNIQRLSRTEFPLAYSSRRNAEMVAGKFGIASVIQLPVAYIKP